MELNVTLNNEKSICSNLGISKERESEIDDKVRKVVLTKRNSLKSTDLKTLAEFCTNLEEFAYAAYSYGAYTAILV